MFYNTGESDHCIKETDSVHDDVLTGHVLYKKQVRSIVEIMMFGASVETLVADN